MESRQMHGVCETVSAFSYRVRAINGNQLEWREYKGHQRIVGAFEGEAEAREYLKLRIRERDNRRRGGCVQRREFEYKLCTEALYEIVLVDVIPSVTSIPY